MVLPPTSCLQVGMALDSRPVVTWELDIKHVSGANPLADPTWGKGGQAELTQLQEELTRLNCALPLQQVGAGGQGNRGVGCGIWALCCLAGLMTLAAQHFTP